MTETRTAVMLMSYGTPRTRAEILPYYTDIRRGNPPTEQQLADLTARYDAIGGISPLAERTEAQRTAVQAALDELEADRYHVALGTKHAQPSIEESVDDLASRGFRRVVGLVLAPHYSAFSVGQYLDRLSTAAASHDMAVAGIRSWATEPAFVDFVAAEIRSKLSTMPQDARVFTRTPCRRASSPPATRTRRDRGNGALRGRRQRESTTGARVAERRPHARAVAGPDILQVIDELGADGHTTGLLVSAVGFVADHLEVLYDLDIEAARAPRRTDLAFARTACVNDDPR
jgi:ferrochelatase